MPGGTEGRRGPRPSNRLFVDALLLTARFGGRWRDPPEAYGSYQSVKRRHDRWIDTGVPDGILAALTQEADLERLMIGSTIVRAHQHAAGAREDERDRMPRAWAGLAAA